MKGGQIIMAGVNVNYIIRLLADDSALKKQLQSSEKNITNLNAHERAEVKATLKAKMDAITAHTKAARKSGNLSMIDTSGLKDELQMLKDAFQAMKELNPAEDWAKSGKMFVQSFSAMHSQLSELSKDIAVLKDSIAGLGGSFKDLGFDIVPQIDVAKATKQATKAVDGVGDVIVNRVHGVSESIRRESNKASKFLTDMNKNMASAKNLGSIDVIRKKLNSLYSAFEVNYSQSVNDEAARYAKEILDTIKYAEKEFETFSGGSIFKPAQLEEMNKIIDEQTKEARQKIKRYEDEVQRAFELDLADKLTKNLKGLNLSIELPKQADFVKKINTFVDSVNKKNLHAVKVQFDDSFDLNKKKRNKKNDNEVQATGTDQEQELNNIITDSGLKKLEAALGKFQEVTRKKTTEWRAEMKKMLEFKEGDFQFNFGNALMKDLQEYFAEPGHELNIFINEEDLKSRIENVIKDSGGVIGSSSGTATIEPKMMASAMYSAIVAAMTGKEMPAFDFIETTATEMTEATEGVSGATEEATDSNKKYVKTLTESTIHIDKVVASLKKFASIAPNSKAGRGVNQWFDDRGIDMSLIRAGAVSDAEIIDMLQEAWMSEDKMGHATGATTVDQIEKFFAHYKSLNPEKGAGKALATLQTDITELFKMLEIPLETIEEWQKRNRNLQIYEDAAKYGRGLALLNKFRPKLHPGIKNKNDPSKWKKAPKKAMGENATAEDLSQIKVEDIDDAIKYLQKQREALQQEEAALTARIQNLKDNPVIHKLEASLESKRKDRQVAEQKEEQLQSELNGLTDKSKRGEISKALEEATKQKELLKSQENDIQIQINKLTKGNSVRTLERKLLAVQDEIKNFNTESLEDLKIAREALGDSPATEEIKAFQQVAAEFYEKSKKVFDYLNTKYGNFAGDIYIQGRKNPIEVKSPNDILTKIPEDAIIVDPQIYNDISSSRVGDFDERKSENRTLREQGKLGHQSKKVYEQDVLYEEIEVVPFKPQEIGKIQEGLTEQHFDKQLQSINSDILEIRERIKQETTEIESLIETKSQLENAIATLVGVDELSTLKTDSFQTYKKRSNSINEIVRGVNSSLRSGDKFSITSTDGLNSNESDLARRLNAVLQNVYTDTTASQELANKIAEIENAQALSKEDLEFWRSKASEIVAAQNKKRQLQQQIESLNGQLSKGEIDNDTYNKLVGINKRLIDEKNSEIAALTKLFDGRSTDANFYRDILYDKTKINQQLAGYKSQKSEIDTRIGKGRESASKLIKSLDEQNKPNISNATEEAKQIAAKLIEIKNRLYAEAEQYVAILNNPATDDNTKQNTIGKLQQTLGKLNTISKSLFADIQPFVTDAYLYEANQEKNVAEWTKKYTDSEVRKLQVELSKLRGELTKEEDAALKAELEKKIAGVEAQLEETKKSTLENVVSTKNKALSSVETQLNEKQSALKSDKTHLHWVVTKIMLTSWINIVSW